MSLTIKLQLNNIGTSSITCLNLNPSTKKIHKGPNFIVSKPIYHSNLLTPFVFHQKITPLKQMSSIKSSLIDPDGGSLVDLVVPEAQRAVKASEAESLPKVKLTKIDFEWVHVISEGWANPLKGFMRENEYLQSLHFNSLKMEDGSVVNMSLPIVLAIDDDAKQTIGSSPDVALLGPNQDLVAILRRLVLQASFVCDQYIPEIHNKEACFG